EALRGPLLGDLLDHLQPAAARHVDVQDHDIGLLREDQPHRVLDGRRVAQDLDQPVELGAHARAEQLVIVDQDDRRHGSITSSTSVPSGPEWTAARPPWRSIRPTIDSRTPRRSSGTVAGTKPGPRSRTNTSTRSPATSA